MPKILTVTGIEYWGHEEVLHAQEFNPGSPDMEVTLPKFSKNYAKIVIRVEEEAARERAEPGARAKAWLAAQDPPLTPKEYKDKLDEIRGVKV